MTCPNADILSRFAEATLVDHEAEFVVAHLAVCEVCSRKVDEMEHRPEQPMIAAFRGLQDAPADATDPPLPRQIGQYEILEKIGHGGMGVVYRAVHPHLKREVALKVIRDSRLADPTARERFVQEMQSLGKLSHPNIVHATDAGIDGDMPFIVTELFDGQDLGSYIAEHGKMPVKQAVDCMRQAATGLAYAHKAGYVHRDIKPSNLFLLRNGNVKILDLGIARPVGVEDGQTVTGHVVGSPEFMAPEQFRGGTVDARSDIYSLGQTFASLLGEPVPSRLKPILARMTAGLPEQRYQRADELIRALTAVTRGPGLVFCSALCAAALITALAVAWFMWLQSTNVPVVEPSNMLAVTESKAEQKIETPASDESPPPGEIDAIARHFDITSTTGWDGFFEDILNFYLKTRHPASDLDDGYNVFLLLHQMGRRAEADRLIGDPPLGTFPTDAFEQRKHILYYALMVSIWERTVGNDKASGEWLAEIERIIRDEPSELKRDDLRRFYEDRKRNTSFWAADATPRDIRRLITLGEPSVKDLCSRGLYQEAVDRYLTLAQKVDFWDNTGASPIYDGYGAWYVIAKMVEQGEVDAARKLMQDAPHSTSMGFRMANSLALGYIKSDRKNEAQSIWDESIEKLSETMKAKDKLRLRTRMVCALLESVADSGLYEYVRTEAGK